jgi:hypothetical protein
MTKWHKRTPETVAAVFSRMLNGKPDEHRTVLEVEKDNKPGNMNTPGAAMRYHILDIVPDGEYTLTYNGKSEKVTVGMNNIVWEKN